MEIRKAKKTDLNDIYTIEHDSIGLETKNTILSSFQNHNFCYFVCEDKGRVLGFILVSFASDEAEIISIAVDKDFRRNKIGQSLLDFATKFLLTKKIRTIFLEVSENNKSAICFYLKNGFVKSYERKNYYFENGRGTNALVLRKILD